MVKKKGGQKQWLARKTTLEPMEIAKSVKNVAIPGQYRKRPPMIDFTFAPENAHPFAMGKHFNFKRADIWVDHIWNYEQWCNKKFNLDRDLEDITIKQVVSVVAHELMHILCKTNNEEFIMAIPKTHDAYQWNEKFVNAPEVKTD